jgi:hypothetical protein
MTHRLPAVLTALALATGALVAAAPPAAAASSLRFGKIYYDSPGSDTRTNTSLDAEWAIIKNVATTTKCLTGYTVRDTSAHVYTFGTFCLGGGKSVYLHTGKGTNTASHRYWGSGAYIWNNTGDTAYLKTSGGTLLDSCHWAGGAPGYVYC